GRPGRRRRGGHAHVPRPQGRGGHRGRGGADGDDGGGRGRDPGGGRVPHHGDAVTGAPLRWLGAILLVMALGACAGALFLAPPGSTISLIANPSFVASDGGVSVITAVVIEPAGTPVADGTVI